MGMMFTGKFSNTIHSVQIFQVVREKYCASVFAAESNLRTAWHESRRRDRPSPQYFCACRVFYIPVLLPCISIPGKYIKFAK